MGSSQTAELAALAKLPDEEIDTRDIPEIKDWRAAEIGKFYRPRKQSVTIRLDADILAWFKARSPKYQTAVNRVLRDHVMKDAGPSGPQPSVTKREKKSARG
jgi:uncharacterized protein (DUF4415 family)